MQLFTPLVPDPAAPLALANPLAKLAAALVVMGVLFVSVDPLTAGLMLAAVVAAVPFTGLRPMTLLARTWPLLLAALSVGVLNAVFAGEQTGEIVVRIGPLAIGSENLVAGFGLGLRLLGIALAGLLALASTDPTDLADALMQQLHLSPRVAVAVLAALRLLPILADEWQTIALARRARGVDAGRSPLSAARIFFGQLLALLVGAVRRATRLALAMEARGLGSRPCRTSARPQRVRLADWLLVALACVVAAGAVAVSVTAGSWRSLLG